MHFDWEYYKSIWLAVTKSAWKLIWKWILKSRTLREIKILWTIVYFERYQTTWKLNRKEINHKNWKMCKINRTVELESAENLKSITIQKSKPEKEKRR